jgi:PII-like signaling protein
VAFEIETSWRTRKHIKGDIFNLLYLKPSLGVIVLCLEGDEKVERLRRSVKEYLNRMGLSGSIVVWSEGDVDELWHRIVQRE